MNIGMIVLYTLLIVCIIILLVKISKLYKYRCMTKINKTASYCGGSEKISIKTNTKNNRKKKK